MFFACAVVLSIVEGMIPPIPLFPPGVKLGLANIAVMYCLFFTNPKDAFIIMILKSLFVFIMRGATASILSFSGGLLSLLVMMVLMYVFKTRISYLILSIVGAVSHNIGQFFAVTLIMGGFVTLYYLPILIVAGLLAGIATATLLRFVLPALKGIVKNNKFYEGNVDK